MAYGFVAEAEASTSASGTSLGVTLGTNPTAGNLLYLVAAVSVDTTCTFSDTLSNTMTPIGDIREAAIADRIFHAYSKNITGGADTVTASYGASGTNRRIYVLELSGLDTTAPLVDNAEGTDTGNNPTDTVTCTNAGTAGVFLILCTLLQGGTPTVGTGLTLRTSGLWASASSKFATIGYQNTGADSSNYSGNFGNSAFDRQTTVAAIFQESATVPPPSFSVQPTDQTAADGGTASFTTTVTGATSYQWETLAPGGGSWGNVSGGSGGTTDEYTTPTLARLSDAGRYYRLKASNSAGDTYSNVVNLRVTAIPASYDFGGFVIGAG